MLHPNIQALEDRKAGRLARFRDLILYDPTRGTLTARTPRPPRIAQGQTLGTLAGNRKALVLRVEGETYFAHRLVHWMMMGDAHRPEMPVVGLNGNACDLRWANLHQLTEAEVEATLVHRAAVARNGRGADMGLMGKPPGPVFHQTDAERAALLQYDPDCVF
jgi:hypothetical protein